MSDTTTNPHVRPARVRDPAAFGPATGSPIAHLPTLDGLRGVAVLLILWHHAPLMFLERAGLLSETGFWRMSATGWCGVDLFFVVSGFLITTILVRSRSCVRQLRVFWWRRALRILPLAYVYLLLLAIPSWLGRPWGCLEGFDAWPLFFLYLANVHAALYGFTPIPVMILWSLAVEEQFYAVWPFVVRFMEPRRLLRVCVVLFTLAPLLREVVVQYPAVYTLPFCRLDSLCGGAALAVLLDNAAWRDRTLLWCRRLAWPAVVAVVLVLVTPYAASYPGTRPYWFTIFGYTWLAAAFTVIVGASVGLCDERAANARAVGEASVVADARRGGGGASAARGAGLSMRCGGLVRSWLCQPVLTYIGRRCYGFYLWHGLVGAELAYVCRVRAPGSLGFAGMVVVWLAATGVVVAVSWVVIERPCLRLKRLFPHGAVAGSRVVGVGAGVVGGGTGHRAVPIR